VPVVMIRFLCRNCFAEFKTRSGMNAAQRELGEAGWRIERWDPHGWCLVCLACRENNVVDEALAVIQT
jgi:hypothetical protein